MVFSLFIGNLFVFFKFQGLTHIDEGTRDVVIYVLSATATIGIVILVCLPPIREDEDSVKEVKEGPWETFKNALKLFVTPRMLLLLVTFVYTGNTL